MNEPLWLIYGANGYTGRRIAREAVTQGLKPILAGRDARQVSYLATQLGCPSRIFALDDSRLVIEQLQGLRAVLHCAGPFSSTAEPMMDACLEARVNYLDITGEIAVIEAAAVRHERAVRAGIALLPSVGFDVVPSDCLAAMLAERLPGARQLQLAFTTNSPIGPGTARTIVEGLAAEGCVRVAGRLVRVPIAWKTLMVAFRSGPRLAVTVPWGDVATAWYTTGIPDIEAYAAMPPQQIAWMRRLRLLRWLLRVSAVRQSLGFLVRRSFAARPQTGKLNRASFWGRVSDAQSHVEATLETPEGYRLTVLTALAAVEKVLGGEVLPGFLTPARAFGPQFILSIPETDLRWQN